VNGPACAVIALGLALVPLFSASALDPIFGGQKHRNEEPKSQVQPLPPQPPMALKADAGALDFHLSPLLKSGGLAAQIRQSLNDLIRDTHGETIIKLRAFVAGAGDARRVQAEVVNLFTEHKLPLPVLTVLQVGALGQEAAKVVIEAVVSTRRQANPNGLAFFAGQGGTSLAQALGRLQESVQAAGVAPDAVLVATCFTARLEDWNSAHGQVLGAFPHANVNLVQALRDPASDGAVCEAIGQLTNTPADAPVVLLESRRATLVGPHPLVFTGLQLSFGSYLDDAHEAFVRLERAATALDPVEAPVHVNVFSLDPAGGSALRKTTAVPPSTFTVETIEGLPSVDATAGIEAILAPGVPKPALR
jgi:enamine deaminase RidA (YjgF/YER057c/UK114 family)